MSEYTTPEYQARLFNVAAAMNRVRETQQARPIKLNNADTVIVGEHHVSLTTDLFNYTGGFEQRTWTFEAGRLVRYGYENVSHSGANDFAYDEEDPFYGLEGDQALQKLPDLESILLRAELALIAETTSGQ